MNKYIKTIVIITSLYLLSGCVIKTVYEDPCFSRMHNIKAAQSQKSLTCGNSICELEEDLYSCPIDCKEAIPTLESDKEYTIRMNERYQFEFRQIELGTILDDSIIVNVKFDTFSIGQRIDVGSLMNVQGILITLVKVHFEIENEKRFAVIKLNKLRN